MSAKKPREHGTMTGATQHARARERKCDPCKAAWAAYLAEWRARDGKTARAAALTRARDAADRRLHAAHPDEWRGYYDDALAADTPDPTPDEAT